MLIFNPSVYTDPSSGAVIKTGYFKIAQGKSVEVAGEELSLNVFFSLFSSRFQPQLLAVEYLGLNGDALPLNRSLIACFDFENIFYSELTIHENLLYFAQLSGLTDIQFKQKINWFQTFFDLSLILNKRPSMLEDDYLKLSYLFLLIINSPSVMMLSSDFSNIFKTSFNSRFANLFKNLQMMGVIIVFRESWHSCFDEIEFSLKI